MKHYIYETQDYGIILLDEEMRDKLDTNYGIWNKTYNVMETAAAVLFGAYELIEEMQAQLNAVKKTTLKVAKVH